MAKILLFVHGTGVREVAYHAAAKLVQKKLDTYAPEVSLVHCLWGDTLGATLSHGGKSVPDYGITRSIGHAIDDTTPVLWDLLLQDPTFQLRMIALRAAPLSLSPNEVHPVTGMLERFAKLDASASLNNELKDLGLDGIFEKGPARPLLPTVLGPLIVSDAYEAARKCVAAGGPEHAEALAMAVVASLQKEALIAGAPMLDAAARDQLTLLIESLLGDDVRGIVGTMFSPLAGLLLHAGTWLLRRKRTALTDAAYPAAGDILLYQVCGSRLREFIRAQIAAMPDDEVFVLAHSLGGIACVEMLVEQAAPNVRQLITFGSQAPFLYEIGALARLPSDKSLPSHFPPWRNFYDLNDPLSYIGEGVFPGRVSDFEIESGESFPASHSAYLHSAPFWLEIQALFRHA